jgi:hypothetical protein
MAALSNLKRMKRFLIVGVLASLWACGPDDPNNDPPPGSPCEQETRDDEFVVGLAKNGLTNALKATLDVASPAPPDQGMNEWTVSVLDPQDNPMDGCTMTVTPFMPDHNHGTSPATATVSAGANAGEYNLTSINFFMGGLWETTFEINCSGTTDTVVYRFCVEG